MTESTQQFLIVAFYNLFILCLATYLVTIVDFSPWWYLAAAMCMASFHREKDEG